MERAGAGQHCDHPHRAGGSGCLSPSSLWVTQEGQTSCLQFCIKFLVQYVFSNTNHATTPSPEVTNNIYLFAGCISKNENIKQLYFQVPLAFWN